MIDVINDARNGSVIISVILQITGGRGKRGQPTFTQDTLSGYICQM